MPNPILRSKDTITYIGADLPANRNIIPSARWRWRYTDSQNTGDIVTAPGDATTVTATREGDEAFIAFAYQAAVGFNLSTRFISNGSGSYIVKVDGGEVTDVDSESGFDVTVSNPIPPAIVPKLIEIILIAEEGVSVSTTNLVSFE